EKNKLDSIRRQNYEQWQVENKAREEKFGNLVAQLKNVKGETEERGGVLGALDRYLVPISQGAYKEN
ncbi:TPA: hypothetical protein JLW60_004691, partial [Escherichia coli]|nr:hypothetical protein [Escherichia coli]